MPSSSRFCTDVKPMPLLKNPIETVTNDQITDVMRTPINNRAEQNKEEHVTLPMNTTWVSADIAQPNAIGISIPSSAHEAELLCRLNEMEDLIRRILRMLAPIKKSYVNSYADSPFTDNIALAEMPWKFSFPNIKLYDRTTDLDDHIAQYKQHMFTTTIPRDLREACMCKGFGSSLIGPAL